MKEQSKWFIFRGGQGGAELFLFNFFFIFRHFIEKRTLTEESKEPAVPYFEYHQEPSDNGLAKFRINWKPNSEGHAGTHFFTQYR